MNFRKWWRVSIFIVLKLGCGVAKEMFEAGLSRVVAPALLPWGATFLAAPAVPGRAAIVWVDLCKLVLLPLRL